MPDLTQMENLMFLLIFTRIIWIFTENIGQKYINIIECVEPKSMKIIFRDLIFARLSNHLHLV